ncbi:MAG: PIN domain-containing protein [Gammaproteobacteria bacterium]
MIFDTDILIWVQRGNRDAARLIDQADSREISILSYMELLQGARDKKQHQVSKAFLRDFDFITLPLSENIGHRAAVYVEEYALARGMRAADALVAATAVENGLPLCTANRKHFEPIADLDLHVFVP